MDSLKISDKWFENHKEELKDLDKLIKKAEKNKRLQRLVKKYMRKYKEV